MATHPAAQAKPLATSSLDLPPDTYIYTLSLIPSTATAATISSNDSLTYFNTSTLQPTHTIPAAHKGITSLTTSATITCTAGRDTYVRTWDPRAPLKPVLSIQNPKGTGLTALAHHDNLIASGTESTKEGLSDVSVLLWDIRSPKTPFREYNDSHTDTITSLGFNGTKPSTLLSASTDGLVSLFDTLHVDEEDALSQVLNHGAGVVYASFATETEVVACSADEQVSVYSLLPEGMDENDEEAVLDVTVFGDVRATLGAAYVVDVVRGDSGCWVVGGDANLGSLTLTPLRPKLGQQEREWEFDLQGMISLKGAHGEEVVRDLVLDELNHRILTCGEDGCVRLWSTPEGQGDAMDVEPSGKSKKSKRKDKSDKDKARYKPY